MLLICHRVNEINHLMKIPTEFGVEIDIRTLNGKLILAHDPFTKGICLDEWIKHFKHKLIIANVKEEGLENEIISIFEKNNINNYFFLDQSIPFLIKTIKSGNKNVAIRLSEYESIDNSLRFVGMAKWVWIDFFNFFPLDQRQFKILKSLKFQICLVSPELQGYSKEYILDLKKQLSKLNLNPDAVCTKFPSLWI